MELQTKWFGRISCDPKNLLRFPCGIPGFEHEREFLSIEEPGQRPLVFLQSASTPDLCFITIPARLADQEYQLWLTADDREMLGLPASAGDTLDHTLLCLIILTVQPGRPLAMNLMAPVVINPAASMAVQSIQPQGVYGHQQPFSYAQQEAACW
jgi:flagellar assembly factor FliW